MWIELTDSFGQPVTLNSRHIVALKTCGETTLVAYLGGEALVLESHSQIKAALKLQTMDRLAHRRVQQVHWH